MNGLYSIYRTRPRDGKVERQRAGRILVRDGAPVVLEDHHGRFLRDLATDPDRFPARMARLRASSHYEVRSWDPHLGDGSLAELPQAELQPLPVASGGPQALPPAVFDYHRAGMDRPHLLEARDGAVTLDGKALEPHEHAKVLENVRAGAATLRYRAQALGKAEDPNGGVQDAVPTPDLIHDPMVPKLGNLHALTNREFKEGEVCTAFDLNDFSRVNDEVGWREGDEAIQAYGGLVAKVGGAGGSYRDGGDSFVVFHAGTDEQVLFLREMQEAAAELPPVGGKLRMTAAFGTGPTVHHAREAVQRAKVDKYGADGQVRDSVSA